MSDLKEHVKHIVYTIENGVSYEDAGWEDEARELGLDIIDPMTGMDYLADALDIQYIVDGNKEYLGARVLVAFGGPNIWIDTLNNRVEGAWCSDKATIYYNHDLMDIDDALRELWECK
jgi:hypothetical protein